MMYQSMTLETEPPRTWSLFHGNDRILIVQESSEAEIPGLPIPLKEEDPSHRGVNLYDHEQAKEEPPILAR